MGNNNDLGKRYNDSFQLNTFIERLDELLSESGMNQKDLSDKIGVSANSISRWKSGAVGVPYRRIVQIAQLFGVSPEYLYIEDAPRVDEKLYEKRMDNFNDYYKPYESCLSSVLKVIASLGYEISPDLDNGVYEIVDNKNHAVAYLDKLLIEKILTGIKYSVLSDMERLPQ